MRLFNIIFIILLGLFSSTAYSQAPSIMSYQAVIRDNTGAIVASQPIGIKISILQGSVTGTPVYVEEQSPTSNSNGLISIQVGSGQATQGSIQTIDWASGPYFIQSSCDISGGNNYSVIGTTQLLSVPYALYAANSGSSTPGPQGPAGPAGSNTGTAGPAGPKGDTGATGAQGPKGDAGSVPSIQSVNLTQWTMSTATPGGGSESSAFGSLLAGKKYFFSVVVSGKLPTNVSTFRTVPELKCSDNSATLNYDFSYGLASSSDATEDYNRISFFITGTVAVTSNSSFSVLVKDILGSGRSVTLIGTAVIHEVGSIN